MSLFAKLKKAREDKKGFTLVELIVVLVILAILAAIMVPALTKWIDKAKEKQLVVTGRTIMLAGQSAASEAYGKSNGITETAISTYLEGELPTGSSWNITFTNYKVTGVQYSDGADSISYSKNATTQKYEWVKDDTAKTDVSTLNSATDELAAGDGTIGNKVD